MRRWNEVRQGEAQAGILGTRVMERAGDAYLPSEAEIRSAATYRGKVNDDVATALRSGVFSATTVMLVATDVMRKWKTRTQEAKQVAMRQFTAFLEAT